MYIEFDSTVALKEGMPFKLSKHTDCAWYVYLKGTVYIFSQASIQGVKPIDFEMDVNNITNHPNFKYASSLEVQ